jgi:hypothetical protein
MDMSISSVDRLVDHSVVAAVATKPVSKKPTVNRTKVQAHASLINDSVYVITRSAQLRTDLDPRYTSVISTLSSLNVFTGSIGVIDGIEQFQKKAKVNYTTGAIEALFRIGKGFFDILSGLSGTMIAFSKIIESFKIPTEFSVHPTAMSALKMGNSVASVVSNVFSIGYSSIIFFRSSLFFADLYFAKNQEEKLIALGIEHFSTMSKEEIEACLLSLKDKTGVKVTEEELRSFASGAMDEIKEKMFIEKLQSGARENALLYLSSMVLSLFSLTLNVLDKITGSIAGTVLEMTYLCLSASRFLLDMANVYRSTDIAKEGEKDRMVHRIISIVFSAISIAGIVAASVASGGIAPCACMIIAMVGPLIVNGILHLINDPDFKQKIDDFLQKFHHTIMPRRLSFTATQIAAPFTL